jgi:hypothetical protein
MKIFVSQGKILSFSNVSSYIENPSQFMKCSNRFAPFLGLGLLFLTGCRICDCAFTDSSFRFRILDKETGKNLITNQPEGIHLDSIIITTPAKDFMAFGGLGFQWNDSIVSTFLTIEKSNAFFFQLNHLDTDTLILSTTRTSKADVDCCGNSFVTVDAIYYNCTKVEKIGNEWVLRK